MVRGSEHRLRALGRGGGAELRLQQRGSRRGGTDFASIQASHLRAFREASPAGRNARAYQGLVVLPTDSATPSQRAKHAAYVAARTPRVVPLPFGFEHADDVQILTDIATLLAPALGWVSRYDAGR